MALVILALVAGSAVYCVLVVTAAVRYRSVSPLDIRNWPAISVLKPLAGIDEGLEENLASFFEQKYPYYEILFAVRDRRDPAVQVVEELRSRYRAVPSRLIITGEPPYPNAKVYSLDRMLACAHYDLLVMTDSDVRVTPDMLSTIAAEFEAPSVGMVTCPYRAVPGRSFWSKLEALGLNTEFLSGVLVARMLDGVRFALGPAIAARRATLEAIGGFDAVRDYLAEDFVMGKLAADKGFGVILSSYVIQHRIGAQRLLPNARHRLRWNRSTRRSRPLGYIGQVFTNPLPLALALIAVNPGWWQAAAMAMVFRAAAAWTTAEYVLRDPLARRAWWLLPVQDMASFAAWLGGFFGNTVIWRGRKYHLRRDGRFDLVQ